MNVSGFHLHYRSAFELHGKPSVVLAWRNVVAMIQAWVTQKVSGQQIIFGPEFFNRGEWKNSQFPRMSIRVESVRGNGSAESPEFWAMCFEHPCGQVASRQWQTQIGLTHSASDIVQVAVTTIHWLPDYVGDEPISPVPTSPQIVKTLISNEAWEGFSGSEQLSAAPKILRVGYGDHFFERLKDNNRVCPIVYVSREHNSERSLVDPIRLARNLAGMASVYVAESTELDHELEIFIQPSFRCANGMVRVYQPAIRFENPSDYRRHRFFPRAYILDRGTFHAEEIITKGLARRSLAPVANIVASLDDVSSRGREARLHSLRAEVESAATQREMIELYVEEIRKFEEKIHGLEEENRIVTGKCDELDDTVDRLEYESALHKQRAAHVDDLDAKSRAQVDAVQNLTALPETLSEVIKLLSIIYSDRVCFTERALKSANGYQIERRVAWECLRAMATVLYDLYFTQDLTVREIGQAFRSKTGYEIGLFDSESTKNNTRLGLLRQDIFENEKIDISTHVKHRTKKPNLLRVHFYVHHEKKLLIIGHCGDHLETVRTN